MSKELQEQLTDDLAKLSVENEWFARKLADEPSLVSTWGLMAENGVEKALRIDIDFIDIMDDYRAGRVSQRFPDDLNVAEEAVLRFYTTPKGFTGLNQALRGEIPMTDKFRTQQRLMDNGLEKLPNYGNQGVLWRGLKNVNLEVVQATYVKGTTVTERAFISTAYDLDDFIASSRQRDFEYIFKIEGNNGKLIEPLSTFPEEAEVLFKSNTRFEVLEAKFDIHPDTGFGVKSAWTVTLKEK